MDEILMKWLKQLEYTLADTMPMEEDEPEVYKQQHSDLFEIKQLILWSNNKFKTNEKASINYNQLLSAGNSYKLGKFQLILNEETKDLRVIVHTNSDHMRITPKADNSVLIHACR